MKLFSYGMTDCGRHREQNEDAFYISEAHRIFAVADGLGGLPGGADASRTAVELLAAFLKEVEPTADIEDLSIIVNRIHKKILEKGNTLYPFTGQGTTLSIGQIQGEQLSICHAGDSAIYLQRHGKLQKITTDHTLEHDYIEQHGEASREFMPHEYPHTLTRCLGQSDTLDVEHTHITIKQGDRIMLCTDGLNKVLSHERMEQLIHTGVSPKAICEDFVSEANDNGGPDNITVIMVFIGDPQDT